MVVTGSYSVLWTGTLGMGYIWDGVGAGLGAGVEVPENKLKLVGGAIILIESG